MDSRYRFYGLNTAPSAPVTPLTSLDLVPFAWPSDWSDVQIAFELIEPGDESTVFAELRANVTNVVVTPVPAAAWLFGSSLGLLGWMRRRQK